MSFHLQIKLIPSCCAASVDPRMVRETSPASSRKVGIESQQTLGEEGLLEVLSSVVCSGPCLVSFEHHEGWGTHRVSGRISAWPAQPGMWPTFITTGTVLHLPLGN